MDNIIKQAIDVVKGGGIIIYPTDTAFGIGCRIDKPESIDRLFAIRKRPLTQAMPVLVSTPEMALAYFDAPGDIVRRLMKQYWPGALTIVAPCKTDLLYSPIRGGGKTVGLRMPAHETARAIIAGIGVPMVGPSANFHGGKTPFTQEDLDPELMRLVDLVVSGKTYMKSASTVVDTTTKPAKVVRQGAITLLPEDLI